MIIYDGIHSAVTEEWANLAYYLRHRFMVCYKNFEELEDITFEKLENVRKEMITSMKEFIKVYGTMKKKAHKDV